MLEMLKKEKKNDWVEKKNDTCGEFLFVFPTVCVCVCVSAANTRGFACLHVCYCITRLSKHADDHHFCGCATARKSQVPYRTSETNPFCSAAGDVPR